MGLIPPVSHKAFDVKHNNTTDDTDMFNFSSQTKKTKMHSKL